jgi:3'-phosphoadenosine 5'-phosphosulfate sulfotransferase (PAPS reductase)/FAD synthetase
MITVLSLGWGVQSFTIAAMVAIGELQPITAAIHADTTHERTATYNFARQWTPWLEQHGVKVITVHANNTDDVTRPDRPTPIPAFTTRPDGTPSGLLRRQCTTNWKIRPIRQWLQANRNKQPVTMWIGISLDEIERIRPSDVHYITNAWPLTDLKMTRNDCINWLTHHNLPIPPRSACVFCPYQSITDWQHLHESAGNDWKHAIEIDNAIRHKKPGYIAYLTYHRKPLADIEQFKQHKHQPPLFTDECTGHCFL